MAKDKRRKLLESLQGKLLVYLLALALIPLLAISIMSYMNTSRSLRKEAFARLTSVAEIKKTQIANYFSERAGDLDVLSTSDNVKKAFDKLKAYHDAGGVTPEGAYNIQTEEYQKIYREVDPFFSKFVQAYGYYDIFMMCKSHGHVMYTEARESDLGQNLDTGQLKDSGLAELWKKVAKEQKVSYVDYEHYAPSNEPAMFMGAPVFDANGQMYAVLVLQISTEQISAMMTERAGLGETGETYLVGSDHLMRSESRFEEGTILKKKVETEAIREGLAGKSDAKIIKDYRGASVLSVYAPLTIDDIAWVIISEIDTAEAFASIANVRNWMLLIGLITGGVVVMVALTVARNITNPVRNLVDVSGVVAQGDLTAEMEIETDDEIGQLAGAFQQMVGNLREIIGRIIATSVGVSASSQQLSSAAQESNASMEEISSAIDQLAKGAQTQAQRVEETSKVMEQLSASISQGAQSSQEAASASSLASQSAQNGADAVNTAIETMDKIEHSTNVTSQAVTQLGRRSEQMAQIVDVITNVADQTNLLALNAAIEAARAGEAGRGFAVVAEEVSKLAENSSKSAIEIGQLIKETLRETEAVVSNMETCTKEVASGKKMIANAGDTLGVIQQANQNISTMLQQISASSQQMAAGAKQVTQSVEEVAAISKQASSSTQQASASSQQMVATMQETASSAQSLSEMGVDLTALVAMFKTGDQEITARAKSPAKKRRGKPMAKRLAEAKKKMERMIRQKSPGAGPNRAVGLDHTEEGGDAHD